MAAYAKLFRSIWTDTDFVTLPANVQRLYLVLISQPDLSAAGVIPMTPGRWASLAPDTTPTEMRTALAHLAATSFVVIDERTDEVLIRSYVTHDEAWRIPNGLKSIANAVDKVISEPIRNTIITTITTLGATLPTTLTTTLRPTHTATGAPPKQPAASSQEPSAISHQPSASAADPQPQQTPVDNNAAAAAIDLIIAHRLATATNIKKPSAYSATLRRTIPDEYTHQIRSYQLAHPDATPIDIAHHIAGVPHPDHDPTWTPQHQHGAQQHGRSIAEAQLANDTLDDTAARTEITNAANGDHRYTTTAWEAYDDTIAAIRKAANELAERIRTTPDNVTPITRHA